MAAQRAAGIPADGISRGKRPPSAGACRCRVAVPVMTGAACGHSGNCYFDTEGPLWKCHHAAAGKTIGFGSGSDPVKEVQESFG